MIAKAGSDSELKWMRDDYGVNRNGGRGCGGLI